MSVSLISVCLSLALGVPDPGATAPPKPAPLPLFANEAWYKDASGAEKGFEGTVELNPAPGEIGRPKRFNTYRLVWSTSDGTKVTREIYAPGKAQFIGLYVGKRIRLVGKAVDTKADDKTYAEIWPARLEPVGLMSPDAQNGILARCTWQPNAARKRGDTQWVIHNGKDLARHLGYFGADVDTRASQDIAKELKIPTVDWTKQMLVTISAGLRANGERVRVVRVELKERILTVTYKIERPAESPGGIAYPAETVLVDRFEGEVKYEEQPAAAPK